MDATKIKIGDLVKFRAVTRHSDKAVWRKVTGIEFCGRRIIQVRFHGWSDFQVRDRELLDYVNVPTRRTTIWSSATGKVTKS